ncbi:1-acyl-sn-glycerol-3-phosphate acyltransferase [Candidatus Woesearchaeota archaeon]|nr:1-acyl-sn-glycerol-3-phosphate acyltransferase [Candidatus Woesearchaeota archaeon]
MRTVDSLVKLAMMNFLKASAVFYGVKIYGLENVETEKGSVFGVKHANSVDLPLMVHVLQGKATIFASSHIFKNPAANYMLTVAGAVPLYTAPDYKVLRLNGELTSQAELIKNGLEAQKWLAYAPEGNVGMGFVREDIYPQMLIKAASHGHHTYLVGIKFRHTYHPWFSFVRWPWQNGIEVRIEEYNAAGKPLGLVKEEVREYLARLSGLDCLEQRVKQLAPRNN